MEHEFSSLISRFYYPKSLISGLYICNILPTVWSVGHPFREVSYSVISHICDCIPGSL